jgi:hypothetical protein
MVDVHSISIRRRYQMIKRLYCSGFAAGHPSESWVGEKIVRLARGGGSMPS